MTRRRAVLVAGTAAPALAQSGRPVRVIIPFGAGGGKDNFIRILAPHVARALGQPLVIENRPGGASIIGTEMVARAEPDGQTVLAMDSTLYINTGLFPTLP